MTKESFPVLDKESALNRVDGDTELYDEIVELYLEDTPNQMAILKQSLADQDRELLMRQAHSLKSASANIGAESLRAAALEVEKASSDAGFEALQELVDKMFEEYRRLESVLKETVG